jgi:ABC-type phosphate/phosphonate transport system ATPase subunit
LQFAERIVGLCGGRIRFDLPVDQVTGAMLAELYRIFLRFEFAVRLERGRNLPFPDGQ